MDNLVNAKNQPRRLRGKQKESNGKPNTLCAGEIGCSGGTAQHQQERTDRAYDTKPNTISTGGNASPGKMLEALRLLKAKHLTYIRSHRERMERQLNKNKEEELEFLKECELLEEEILSSLEDE
ncbi:hypothetical protein BCD64_11975 [Nostoc sp. MBR 210]|nr:hypothetical protein BCD64_11975 [Nostoc sp. MBR 210]